MIGTDLVERNKKIILELDYYLDTHSDINRIVTSIELACLLSELEDGTVVGDERNGPDYELVHYKGIRVVVDKYYPVQDIGFVHKKSKIRFDLSCDCSIIELR